MPTPEAQFGADPPEPDAEADKRAAESAARHGKKEEKKQPPPKTATTDDFYAYLPEHLYLYVPTRTLWPAATINSIFGKGASKFLDRTKPCQQMTWCPGKEMIVKDRLVVEGGWIKKQGANCFNKYLPPKLINGDPDKAGPWRKHLEKIFGEDARHIERWLAYRVQHPDIKINHALVIGSGKQGIGKDTTLEPVKRAVGPWNFKDVSAEQALDPKFNPFLESVILRINEARDLGDKDRFAFYDHTKTWMASPPDVISVADKFIRAHPVFNLTGTIITTNHKTDGLYLPAEDRRHYVAWTDVQPEDFEDGYWRTIWNWYADGGIEHAAAYLATLDLHDFDPKAPPLKTAAFWDIVNANRAPEDAELSDVLDRLGDPLGLGEIERPAALTLDQITQAAGADDYGDFYQWITDRKNRRLVPHRMGKCGYAPIRNEHDKHDGQWLIGGKRKVIYGATRLPFAERVKAAQALVEQKHRRAAGRRRGRRTHARSSPGQSTRLRIWGSEFESSPGAPTLSTHLPCKKLPIFTVFARNRRPGYLRLSRTVS